MNKIKEEESRRQQMTIVFAFNFVKFKFGWNARSRKRVAQARSPREVTASTKLMIIYSQIDYKVMRPNH